MFALENVSSDQSLTCLIYVEFTCEGTVVERPRRCLYLFSKQQEEMEGEQGAYVIWTCSRTRFESEYLTTRSSDDALSVQIYRPCRLVSLDLANRPQ